MEIFETITLALSGLLLFSVGTMRLLNPINAYLKNSGITLNNDVDLLNEMRGVSSVMLFGGIIIGLGTLMPALTFTSHIIAILLFLGFAFGRSFSLMKDGKANKQIIQGLVFEVIFGGLNVFFVLTV